MAGGSKSKQKGNNGERELAKILSETFSGNFQRSNQSGAMIGGKNFFKKAILSEGQIRNAKGDLVPPDHMPHFVVEVKSYKDFRFHQLLTAGPCPVLDDWIKQTLDVIDPGDCWFVCFKINLMGWYITVPEAMECSYENHCRYTGLHGTFNVTSLKDFLRLNHEIVLRLSA